MTLELYNDSSSVNNETERTRGRRGGRLDAAVSASTVSRDGFNTIPDSSPQNSPEMLSTNSGGAGVSPSLITQAIQESLAKCGTWATSTHCEGEAQHTFAKVLFCSQEWCPVCGQKGSPAHMRRVSRVLPKAMQLSSMGYLDIEWRRDFRRVGRVSEYVGDTLGNAGKWGENEDGQPVYTIDDLGWVYSKPALRNTTNKIVEVLAGKREGRKGRVGGYFPRGLVRWHWYGDEDPEGRGINQHANVLVEGGRLPKGALNALKIALHDALELPYTVDDKGTIKNVSLIVHYHYSTRPGKMYHWVKYVYRSTFRDYKWDSYMARQLYNFRNGRMWGVWKGEPAWELTPQVEAEAEKYETLRNLLAVGKNECPVCHAELAKWTKAFSAMYLQAWGAFPIGGGYFQIPTRPWSGGVTPENVGRFAELQHKAREEYRENTHLRVEIAHARAKCKPGTPDYIPLRAALAMMSMLGAHPSKYWKDGVENDDSDCS